MHVVSVGVDRLLILIATTVCTQEDDLDEVVLICDFSSFGMAIINLSNFRLAGV